MKNLVNFLDEIDDFSSLNEMASSKLKNGPRDAIHAMKKAGRDEEREILGDGFHSCDRAHKNKKKFCRNPKHKHNYE